MPESGYIAVVYDPTKERAKKDLIGDGWSPLRPPIYPFSCQIPENHELLNPTSLKTKNGGTADVLFIQKYKSIFFRPSANLDILRTDWECCIKDVMVKWRLDNGAMSVVEPDEEALKLEPSGIGYRMYSLENALRLVSFTKDLGTLEEWASMEERKAVTEAIAKQEQAIESHIRMLRES